MALARRNTPSTEQAAATLEAFKPGTKAIDERMAKQPPAAPRNQQLVTSDPRLGDKEYERLSAKIRISKNALDDNAVEHGETYLEIAERSAIATSLADQAKNDLALVDARIARAKRLEPEKVTDKAVEAHVLLHQEHIDAQQTHSAAVAVSSRWRALERAYEHRKSMIRELTGLYASGYWTTGGSIGPRSAVSMAIAERNQAGLADARRERQ